MTDTILRARLVELRRSLQRATLPQFRNGLSRDTRDQTGPTTMPFEIDESLVPERVWGYLKSSMRESVLNHDRRIGNILKRLKRLHEKGERAGDRTDGADDIGRLWDEYRQVETACQSLLSEFVEVIAGLAFRDRTHNLWVFTAADMLAREWTKAAFLLSEDHLAVPSVQETVTQSLVRVVRLRFPDWTIWALPLIAGELVHGFLTAEPRLDSVSAFHSDVADAVERKDLTDDQLQVVDDVVATMFMGPAYAISLVHFRLAHNENRRWFGTLEALRRHKSYKAIVEPVDGDRPGPLSAALSDSSVVMGSPSELEEQQLGTLVQATIRAVRSIFPDVEWLERHPTGWVQAKDLNALWKAAVKDQIDEEHDLTVEALLEKASGGTTYGLRDILNSVWLARLDGIEETVLAGAGERLCEQAIAAAAPRHPTRRGQPGQDVSQRSIPNVTREQDHDRVP